MQLGSIFLQVVNMSLMAAVIIVAILGIRVFLKRAPKIFSYMLWAVVLFRLLCPISFSTELSVFRVLEWVTSEQGQVDGDDTNFAYAGDRIVTEGIPRGERRTTLVASEEELMREGYVKTVIEEDRSFQIGIQEVLVVIWLCGMGGLMGYSAVQMLILRRNLIGAVPYQENIYYADHISTPFVLGIIRPKIYLPSSLAKSEWEYIILHERHHIHRGDHIVRIMAFLALCVHWFNPLVWVAFIQSGKDMEMSCDEAVMRQIKQDIRAEYSESLLRLATGRRYMTAMPLSFGEGDTKGRVKNVMRYKKPTLVAIVGAAVLCVIAVVILGSNPPEEMEETASQEQIEEVISEDAVYVLADMDFEPSALVSAENVEKEGIVLEPLTSSGAGEKGFAIEVFKLSEIWMMDQAYYYYPSQEDQVRMWELLKGIGWSVDDESKPWLTMKEIGWKIHCNQQTFVVFEGGYIYWEKAEQGGETKRYFGQSIKLCDMIQQEHGFKVIFKPIDITQMKGITYLWISDAEKYGFAQNSITDLEALEMFERWFNDAEYISGGVDCEMADITISLEDRKRIHMALAVDGSPVIALNGVYYNFCPMEYRARGDWDMEDFKMYFEPISEQVRGEAEKYVQEQFELYGEGYSDWRIEDLRYQYTYDDFNGMKLQVYRFNYEFLAIHPEEVELVGGMEMDEEGWVVPGYPNSHHLIFEEKDDKLKFLVKFGANDCYPGDELYTSDLQYWWENRNNQ